MSPRQKQDILNRYFQGIEPREIAKQIGCSELAVHGTVWKRLRKAAKNDEVLYAIAETIEKPAA